MPDREKVIKGLESILKETADMFYRSTIQDAIVLLKAQEQKPISASIVDIDGGLMHWWACGNCQAPINSEDKFCHECGRKVNWE